MSNQAFGFLVGLKYIYGTSKLPDVKEMPVVRKGFRARKGQTTCKPETDKFILKMRRHWITTGTQF